jgi:hypothetical protein
MLVYCTAKPLGPTAVRRVGGRTGMCGVLYVPPMLWTRNGWLLATQVDCKVLHVSRYQTVHTCNLSASADIYCTCLVLAI